MTVTVAQLIAELQQYPDSDEVEVLGQDGDFGYLEVSPSAADLQRSGEIVLDFGEITSKGDR